MHTLEVGLQMTEAGAAMELTYQCDGVAVGAQRLTAAEVDGFIHTMTSLRAKMAPAVARQAPDVTGGGVVDPLWAIQTHPASSDKILAIRHPGAGWLSFLLPEKAALALIRALTPNPAVVSSRTLQ
jgi:hypothetical protein